MADYSIKRGESLSKIKLQLVGRNGLPIDLSGAIRVDFFSRHEGVSVNEINGLACTITDRAAGIVTLPGISHLAIGYYEGWFKVVWSGADPDYVPSRDYFTGEVGESWE